MWQSSAPRLVPTNLNREDAFEPFLTETRLADRLQVFPHTVFRSSCRFTPSEWHVLQRLIRLTPANSARNWQDLESLYGNVAWSQSESREAMEVGVMWTRARPVE